VFENRVLRSKREESTEGWEKKLYIEDLGDFYSFAKHLSALHINEDDMGRECGTHEGTVNA
jgi:hypothetical protein